MKRSIGNEKNVEKSKLINYTVKVKREIKGKHTEMYGRKARSLRVVIEERKLLE